MKPICLFIAGALLATACSQEVTKTTTAQQNAPENAMDLAAKTISPAEAKTVVETEENLVILDVRTPEEFAAGHLQNATLLNKYDADFETSLSQLDREKPYLLYCASGGRSGQTYELMQKLGFKKVYDAKGFESLKEAGLPVE